MHGWGGRHECASGIVSGQRANGMGNNGNWLNYYRCYPRITPAETKVISYYRNDI
jgi:hypothetical protein